jgi:hypothetical protein
LVVSNDAVFDADVHVDPLETLPVAFDEDGAGHLA